MSTSVQADAEPRAVRVSVTDRSLVVDLVDGRTVSVPLDWFPRLRHGTTAERDRWELLAGGAGIRWPDLDEDLSVRGLLSGGPSRESPASLRGWLNSRHPA